KRVAGDLLLPAATRLAEASSGLANAGEELLQAARLHAISFRYFWASVEPGDQNVARQACLIVPGSGRTGMCFTTRPRTSEQEAELASVIDHACRELPGKVVRLAQALLEPHEEALVRSFERAGMPRLATLLYLRRAMPREGAFGELEALPDGVELVRYRPGRDEGVLQGVLPRTYEGTLDCPELSNTRRPEDVVASHRSAGAWTPDLWWLLRVAGSVEGVALFNPMPDQDAVELVYLGLTPDVRGQSLGRRALTHALSRLSDRAERWLTCACDERNAPALALYRGLGMIEHERRIALVRVIG
ncbi:MAG: GNAT family N-acetyltransferase, partial [Planctomycetota bacterium]